MVCEPSSAPPPDQIVRLGVLAAGPQGYRVGDKTCARLERRSLIRRVGSGRIGRFATQAAIRWEITEAGLAMLRAE